MAIDFTKREKDLIRRILASAKNDPSIYEGVKTDVAMKRVDAEIEEIERKIHRDN